MSNYKRRTKKGMPEDKAGITLEELELFDEWRRQILPELRELLLKGVPATEILKKYESQAAARLVTIALTDPDNNKALAAIKDIQDRASGKAVERKKIEHAMQDLSDDQLDALLLTEIDETEEEEDSDPIQ